MPRAKKAKAAEPAKAAEDTEMEDTKPEAVAAEEEDEEEEEEEEIANDDTVAAALEAAQMEANAIANASAISAIDPALPTQRDVKFGDETHPGTKLLLDLILMNKVLMPSKTYKASDSDIQDLATKLMTLFLEGKQFALSGLKDVPRPFLVGKGRFFDKKDDEYVELEKDAAKKRLVETIVAQFKAKDTGTVDKEVLETFDQQFRSKDAAKKEDEGDKEEDKDKDENKNGAPRPHDVLFLPIAISTDDGSPYDHQTGNKHLLYLASQNVVVDTKEAAMRVQIAIKLLTSKEDDTKQPRYVLQQVDDDSDSDWKELDAFQLAEFATIFVFEVYLEKQIHGTTSSSASSNGASDTVKASTVPCENPTVHDVLFGRGGMTNGHPGNRRFRDIIALHRPDYIRATKMDKPKVARRIVKAIRHGNPPGRFLKKADDGKWYDVGDRCAAEKTSQGLRERSNAEKRQRSAMREALRINKDDLNDDDDESASNKKAKTEDAPLSLSAKEKKTKSAASKKASANEGETSTEDLPPNAVDKDGNILVTDHDILCGRGGLTNHHKGNKRFRDIVALHRPDYVRAPKIQKPSVARVIVRAIRNGDPPGRFLKKDKKTGMWYDIGDKRAAEKTSQALREKTKEEQDGKEEDDGEDDGPAPILPDKKEKKEGEEKATTVSVAVAAAEDSKEESKDDAPPPAAASKGKEGGDVPMVEI